MATPSLPIPHPQPRLQLKAKQASTQPRSKPPPVPAPTMCKVVITIPSLVWLRRTPRQWRSRAAEAADAAVPAGHVPVSVQGTAPLARPRRFLVRVAHLSHPAFLELLRQAEEYGFPAATGPIALPCDEDRFLDVLRRVSPSSCYCGPAAARRWCGDDARPLLRGMAVRSSSGDRQSVTITGEQVGSGEKAKGIRPAGARAGMQFVLPGHWSKRASSSRAVREGREGNGGRHVHCWQQQASSNCCCRVCLARH